MSDSLFYFRAIALGLLLANTMLLLELVSPGSCEHRHPVAVELVAAGPPPAPAEGGPELNVVDIRREALAHVPLREVLGLGPADRILSVNDIPVSDPSSALASLAAEGEVDYIDLGVHRRGRRVRTVVLVHD